MSLTEPAGISARALWILLKFPLAKIAGGNHFPAIHIATLLQTSKLYPLREHLHDAKLDCSFRGHSSVLRKRDASPPVGASESGQKQISGPAHCRLGPRATWRSFRLGRSRAQAMFCGSLPLLSLSPSIVGSLVLKRVSRVRRQPRHRRVGRAARGAHFAPYLHPRSSNMRPAATFSRMHHQKLAPAILINSSDRYAY